MFQLIETIRLHDGQFGNLGYHEQRMRRAMKELFGVDQKVNLEEMLRKYSKPTRGLYKCRLIYNNKRDEVEFISYTVRPAHWLKIVHDDTISYDHKFEDRMELENDFSKRANCDDVLIIKKGWVTDTSSANIVFRRRNEWITPTSFLLPGTMRQSLLDKRTIVEEEIHVDELSGFESFKLVNAMLMFDAPERSIENIVK
jgi:4-amino-4-deoxychorismate lyase